MAAPAQCKRWCFTLNNYTDAEYKVIIDRINQLKPVYAVVGKEMGEMNIPHLQGFVHLKSKVRLNGLKRFFTNRIHAQTARGSDTQNQEYCCKQDKEAFQYGVPQGHPNSKLNQSQKFRQILAMMDTEDFLKTIIENDDLLSTYVKYKRQITSIHDDIATHNTKVTIQQNYNQFQLKYFQKDVIDIINQVPDSRKVHWFFDYQGNAGKTWLSTLLVCRYNAVRFENAKSADIKHAYNGQPIVVFDLSRSSVEHINYEVIEAIKNGIFFSSKYESKMKIYPTPHVIVFANISPDTTKLSFDRWDLHHIDDHKRQLDTTSLYTSTADPIPNPMSPRRCAPDDAAVSRERDEEMANSTPTTTPDLLAMSSVDVSPTFSCDTDSLFGFITQTFPNPLSPEP